MVDIVMTRAWLVGPLAPEDGCGGHTEGGGGASEGGAGGGGGVAASGGGPIRTKSE